MNKENNNNCPDDLLLSSYLDGVLNRETQKLLEMHLIKCNKCRQKVIIASNAKNIILPELNFEKLDSSKNQTISLNLENELNKFEAQLGINKNIIDKSKQPYILIVDDNINYLNSLSDVLSSSYNITSCSNGKDALNQINNQISTIILDIKMPVLSGIEVARELRKLDYKKPIIFNTGYQNEYKQTEIEKEFNPYCFVTKDDSEKLIKCVKGAVELNYSK